MTKPSRKKQLLDRGDAEQVVEDITSALVVIRDTPVQKVSKPLPPVQRFKRTNELWLNLFRTKDPERSHTLELADDLPMYVYSRTTKGREMKAVEREYVVRGRPFKVTILPAAIKVPGKHGAEDTWERRFPGEREELILEVIKYLASQKALVLDGDLSVPFTYAEIGKILEEAGHAMRRVQIKEGLEVMSRCKNIVADVGGKLVIEESPIKSLITAERGSRVEGVLQLGSYHTRAVQLGDYRGMNFLVAIGYQSLLARRIHKHINNYVTNATTGTPYKATASDLMRLAALSLADKPSKWVRTVNKALDEMKGADYVARYEAVPSKVGGRVQDYIYSIYLTQRFVDEIIRANAQQRRLKFQLEQNFDLQIKE